MSKLLLCSFKHTFMRREHFFTVYSIDAESAFAAAAYALFCAVSFFHCLISFCLWGVPFFFFLILSLSLSLYHSFLCVSFFLFVFLSLCVDWWRRHRLYSTILYFIPSSNKPHLHTISTMKRKFHWLSNCPKWAFLNSYFLLLFHSIILCALLSLVHIYRLATVRFICSSCIVHFS